MKFTKIALKSLIAGGLALGACSTPQKEQMLYNQSGIINPGYAAVPLAQEEFFNFYQINPGYAAVPFAQEEFRDYLQKDKNKTQLGGAR